MQKLSFAMIVLLTFPSLSAGADPLVYGNNLVYKGAFKVPLVDVSSTITTDRGGRVLAFNPAGNGGSGSLFIGGKPPYVYEINTPEPKMLLNEYNTATVLQALADPTEGNMSNIGAGGAATNANHGGLLVYNNKLIGTSYAVYDAGGVAKLSHYTHSLNLGTTGTFGGMYDVGDWPADGNANFVSGFMSHVPDNTSTGGTDWKTALGGPALTGNGTLSVISKTSYGPAIFSFDPDTLTGPLGTSVPATPLLYYDTFHQTLGANASTNILFNGTTKIAGTVFIPETKSVLFFGYHGFGDYLYGEWTTNVKYADPCDPSVDVCVEAPDQGVSGILVCADAANCNSGRRGLKDCGAGSNCYYDPTGMGGKGPHGHPYKYQVWAYNADDLLAVKNGTKQPWEVLPYATWQMPYDLHPTSIMAPPVAYDPATKKLYVVEPGVIGTTYKLPIVHVFEYTPSAPVASGYKVGGTAILLNGTVKLKNNGGDEITLTASSRTTVQNFSFPAAVDNDASYSVTVSVQPEGQTCEVLHGTGSIIARTDVQSVTLTCYDDYSPSPIYYVSPTGNNADDGLSPETAWQTIAKVNSFSFAAGDTIRFASGDYGTTALAPATSGSAGNLITFTSYVGAATKPVLRGGVNLNGRSYVKIDGLDVTSTGITFSLAGATNNTITNSTIYSTAASWSPTISVRNGSHYNKITNNTIGQNAANNDIINLRNDADNNLIENNTITIQGSHAAIDVEGWTVGGGDSAVSDRSGNNNIIRGNTITGHNGSGVHITIQANSYGNVIDRNTLKGDSTVDDYCHLTYPATQPARSLALIKGVGEKNIIRNNILSNYPCQDSEGIFMDTYVYDGFTNNAINNHIYHNVVTGIGSGATGLYFGIANGGTHNNNYVKNNVFVNNGGTVWTRDADGAVAAGTALFQMTDTLDTNYYDKNIFYTSATSGAVIWLSGNYYTVAQADAASTKWTGNAQVNPMLDPTTFLPATGSPALNAGIDLTTITSASGSGTSFAVADAYYFTDGNGITTGDIIEVNNQPTAITEITYGAGTTGTLTVSPAITWTQGMGVNLPFDGNAPHIGLTSAEAEEPPDPGDPPPPSTSTPRIRASFRATVR